MLGHAGSFNRRGAPKPRLASRQQQWGELSFAQDARTPYRGWEVPRYGCGGGGAAAVQRPLAVRQCTPGDWVAPRSCLKAPAHAGPGQRGGCGLLRRWWVC